MPWDLLQYSLLLARGKRRGFSPGAVGPEFDVYILFFLALILASPFRSTFSTVFEIGRLLVLRSDFNVRVYHYFHIFLKSDNV